MVVARATGILLAPLRVSSTRVFVPASTALTNPVPALTCADALGSSAAAADRTETPDSAGVTAAPSSSATAITIEPSRFMTLLLCVGYFIGLLVVTSAWGAVSLRWQRIPREPAS